MPAPSTSVDVCMYDGFGLNSGLTITGGNGALLVNGEAFAWRPWEATGSMELVNKKGQFDLPKEAFGIFDLLWPRPDLLVIGVGKHNLPLSPETKKHIVEQGMRVEVLDTRNAAAQFNLLATERGVSEVAAALIPIGWKEGVGAEA
ncbi:NADH dehydrogenase [ubiquinone] 1 alpha subcomplex assembly factor 3 [Metarhizium anisopliae]|nr:NADH dehydrogenase [ubiquinone] 1 alpha subcomplex assembly factor 3 [Metarhizium anisopliae]